MSSPRGVIQFCHFDRVLRSHVDLQAMRRNSGGSLDLVYKVAGIVCTDDCCSSASSIVRVCASRMYTIVLVVDNVAKYYTFQLAQPRL